MRVSAAKEIHRSTCSPAPQNTSTRREAPAWPFTGASSTPTRMGMAALPPAPPAPPNHTVSFSPASETGPARVLQAAFRSRLRGVEGARDRHGDGGGRP